MSKLSQTPRMGPEDLAGAPSWMLDNFLPFQNSFNADVYSRINGDLGLANLNDVVVASKLTHGVEKRIKNPLWDVKRMRPQGIVAVRTDGYPIAGSVDWRCISSEELGVTVNFQPPSTGRGSQGERISSLRAAASAVAFVTTGTPVDIGSISLTPGTWDLDFGANFTGAPTGTQIAAWIHTVSVTDPTTENGENRAASPTMPTGGSAITLSIAGYRVTPTATTTYYFSAKQAFTAAPGSVSGRVSAVRAMPYLTGYTANVAIRIMGD